MEVGEEGGGVVPEADGGGLVAAEEERRMEMEMELVRTKRRRVTMVVLQYLVLLGFVFAYRSHSMLPKVLFASSILCLVV